ncbi:MAG: peptidoglycan DD-metalloendopeptidase family protein [bacterium]|nr:peptidoglycan DD-metalloendopeptidase family protein [bacterium]
MRVWLRIIAPSLALAGLVLAAAADTPQPAGQADPLAESIRENTQELNDLRTRIAGHRERLSNLDNEEAQVRRSYQEIEQDLEETSRIVGEMAKRERLLEEEGAILATRLETSRTEFANRQEALGRRLRDLYIHGRPGDLRTVLAAASVSDLMARYRMTRTLARLEAGLVEETRTRGHRILQEQRVLDAALAGIWEARAGTDDRNARMELLAAERTAALRELDSERREIKDQLIALDLNEQKLSYVLEDLERQRVERPVVPGAGGVAEDLRSQAGDLAWPVQGEVVRGFGRSVHPRFKTVTLNNGVNIAAAAGSPVAAVADGTVEFHDDLPGFGTCVILDHGGGYYTLYAQLDRVFVAAGAEIAGGQVIAEVGTPAAGGDPELYFEVRHGRTPLDPADWLRSR